MSCGRARCIKSKKQHLSITGRESGGKTNLFSRKSRSSKSPRDGTNGRISIRHIQSLKVMSQGPKERRVPCPSFLNRAPNSCHNRRKKDDAYKCWVSLTGRCMVDCTQNGRKLPVEESEKRNVPPPQKAMRLRCPTSGTRDQATAGVALYPTRHTDSADGRGCMTVLKQSGPVASYGRPMR